MKKFETCWSKSYSLVKVFKDDIEEINRIITSGLEQKGTSESQDDSVEIIADEIVLDNLSELEKLKGNCLRELHIKVGQDLLCLSLTPKRVNLTVSHSDDITLMGIAMKIDVILQKRRRRFLSWLNSSFGALIQGILMGLFSVHYFIVTCLLIILVAVGLWYKYYKVATIYLYSSRERLNFFARNADTIMVNMLLSVFSFSLGIIGTLYFQNKSKDEAQPATSQTVPKDVNDTSQKNSEK